jgi:hypothetical protein
LACKDKIKLANDNAVLCTWINNAISLSKDGDGKRGIGTRNIELILPGPSEEYILILYWFLDRYITLNIIRSQFRAPSNAQER